MENDLTLVSVTTETTRVYYEFYIDSDYEFVKMKDQIMHRSPTTGHFYRPTTQEDADYMKTYWDNSFGKQFFTEYSEAQQQNAYRTFQSIKL